MLCHLAVYVSFVFCPKTVLCKIYVLLRHLTCQCRSVSCKTKYYLNTLYVSRKIYMCCFDISHVIVAVLECIAGLPVSWTVQANAYYVHYWCFSIANSSLPRFKHGQWLARMRVGKSQVLCNWTAVASHIRCTPLCPTASQQPTLWDPSSRRLSWCWWYRKKNTNLNKRKCIWKIHVRVGYRTKPKCNGRASFNNKWAPTTHCNVRVDLQDHYDG